MGVESDGNFADAAEPTNGLRCSFAFYRLQFIIMPRFNFAKREFVNEWAGIAPNRHIFHVFLWVLLLFVAHPPAASAKAMVGWLCVFCWNFRTYSFVLFPRLVVLSLNNGL